MHAGTARRQASKRLFTGVRGIGILGSSTVSQVLLHWVRTLRWGAWGKEEDTMSSTEDQAPKEVLLNTEEDAASRTFAHDPGEGEAWWWFGALATFKATGECGTSITSRMKASTSWKGR